MDTDNLFRLRLSPELLIAINEQATLLKVKPQDVARLALAVGVNKLFEAGLDVRQELDAA